MQATEMLQSKQATPKLGKWATGLPDLEFSHQRIRQCCMPSPTAPSAKMMNLTCITPIAWTRAAAGGERATISREFRVGFQCFLYASFAGVWRQQFFIFFFSKKKKKRCRREWEKKWKLKYMECFPLPAVSVLWLLYYSFVWTLDR